MWKKIKNSLKNRWDKISSKQLSRIIMIECVIWVILYSTLMLFFRNSEILVASITVIMFIIQLVIISFIGFLDEKKKKQEKKIREKAHLQKFFNGKSKTKVRLIPSNRYLYYTEDLYNDLGNLVFSHMVTCAQEKEQFKFYAEIDEHGELNLSMIFDEKDKLNGTKKFDEFPYELFFKYFEPIEE